MQRMSPTEVLREKLGNLTASQPGAQELGMATQGRKTDPLTKEILKNKGSRKANILHQSKQETFLQRGLG